MVTHYLLYENCLAGQKTQNLTAVAGRNPTVGESGLLSSSLGAGTLTDSTCQAMRSLRRRFHFHSSSSSSSHRILFALLTGSFPFLHVFDN